MTTIGRGSTAKIVAACDDGTVGIYDSVTGVLRLSLRPEFPIQEMTDLPDGSLLVCTHKGRPLITLWDIQTGGLVKTFILAGGAKRTAVSLKGRYLACETSENLVRVWEVASRTQDPAPWEEFEGRMPCWLAPEELIMVMDRDSVCIRNVVTKGPPIHKFSMPGPAHCAAVYSQIFDRLVIMRGPYLHKGNYFTTLNVKTGTSTTLHIRGERLSSIAFSQTAEQLVCGGMFSGLEMVDILTGRRSRFDFPATVTSVSTLSNGTVVANVRGSGIQLLSLDQGRAPPRKPTPPLTVCPLDKGRIIVIVPATNDRFTLLETSTMSQVLSTPVQKDLSVATVLCASLRNKISACCFQEGNEGYLQIWEFFCKRRRWTVPTKELPSAGSISPACTRLVTLHNVDSRKFLRVWNAYDGRPLAYISIGDPHAPRPLDITFDSEVRFYLHHDTYREPYVINTAPHQEGNRASHSIIHCAEQRQRLEGRVREERYCLDDGREWVLCGSHRICWVPPGYMGSVPPSHWAGSSLVMLGQDGTLRKLTFCNRRIFL